MVMQGNSLFVFGGVCNNRNYPGDAWELPLQSLQIPSPKKAVGRAEPIPCRQDQQTNASIQRS